MAVGSWGGCEMVVGRCRKVMGWLWGAGGCRGASVGCPDPSLSPQMLLHLFSDANYNLLGFNATYSVSLCPRGCSGRGVCDPQGRCQCQPGWGGPDCAQPHCATYCQAHGGTCNQVGTPEPVGLGDTQTWGAGRPPPVPSGMGLWDHKLGRDGDGRAPNPQGCGTLKPVGMGDPCTPRDRAGRPPNLRGWGWEISVSPEMGL